VTDVPTDPKLNIWNAANWARFYRDRRYNPLPACVNRSRPAMTSYARERDFGFPEKLLARWWTPCVQVCTGVRWDLCVIDIDGARAEDVWSGALALEGPVSTWTVSTPSGGVHLWFRLPSDVVSLPKVTLWEQPDVRHSAVELLGDRCLAMAPPSIREYPGGHVGVYRWLDWLSPHDLDRPAVLPAWVLEWAARASVAARPPAPRPGPVLKRLRRSPGGRYDPRAVIAAIPDKVAVAEAWGLRIASRRPNARGWLRCRAIDREDLRSSASFHPVSGYYSEPFRVRYSLFELGALIGPYLDWRDCLAELARRFGVEPMEIVHGDR
jgi:hypothetical protein